MESLKARLQALTPEQRRLFELRRGETAPATRPPSPDGEAGSAAPADARAAAGMEFSIFFFSDETPRAARDRYELMIESARFADAHGFSAVWTPERHFHAFGGLYPNPAVMAAALAMATSRLELRAGSVVLPLHDPFRVAEEWALVDVLSGGRAAVAFASGWHADDFVFAPERYDTRKEFTFREIDTIRRLWAGETVGRSAPGSRVVDVGISPLPIRGEIPVWITAASDPATYVRAGALGAHLLTGLTGQSVEEAAARIALYRESRARHGHDPAVGRVALMLHTFVGDDARVVRDTVRAPMHAYLRANLGLHRSLAKSRGTAVDLDAFTADDEESLLEYSFGRYCQGSSLLGTPESCLSTVGRLKGLGIDEIACLVDFGLDPATILDGLGPLSALRERCRPAAAASSA